MTFLNPMFLWALLLGLIPIIVHLFDFRRTKKILFSNITFLQNLNEQNTPRKRIKELIILAFRVLAIVFLVLAFCDPVITDNENKVYSNENIVIDNSYSLGDDCSKGDCLEELKQQLETYLSQSNSQSTVYRSSYGNISITNEQDIQALLSSLTLNKKDFSLSDQDLSTRSLTTIFSDFQQDIVQKIQGAAEDSSELLLIPIDRVSSNNVFVDSVYLKNPFMASNKNTELVVSLKNSGTRKAEDVLVRFQRDEQQLSSVAVSLEANEKVNLEFETERSSSTQYWIGIEEGGSDFDNEFYFTLPSAKSLNISVLDNSSNRNLKALFDNPDYFNLSYFTPDNINFQRFSESDLIVLNGFDELPDWFSLDNISADLIVYPGAEINTSNYSNALGFNISATGDTTSSSLSVKDFENPFYEGIFDKQSEKVNLPVVSNIYRSTGNYQGLLTSKKGDYLVRYSSDNGFIYWFNSPLDSKYSNFENHAIFLPIMYRIAEVSNSVNEPLYYPLTDKPFVLNLGKQRSEVLRLIGEGVEFIPEIYPNEVGTVVELPEDLNQSGHYFLLNGSDTISSLALNPNKKESIIDYRSAEELKEIFGGFDNVRVIDTSSSGSLEASLSSMDKGTSLWKYALILALMFLVAETAIHRLK